MDRFDPYVINYPDHGETRISAIEHANIPNGDWCLYTDAYTEIEQLKAGLLAASVLLSTTTDLEHKSPSECYSMCILLGGK